MEELSKEEWNIILSGTGLFQSVLAAAFAMQTKKIIHIDNASYYGQNQATINLKELTQKVLETNKWINPQFEEELKSYPNRVFNIDLSPLVLFSKSFSTDLCLKCGISHYIEFKPLMQVHVYYQNKFITVPCDKAGIFQNKDLTVQEKRALMKFIEKCVEIFNSEALESLEQQSWNDFIQSQLISLTNKQSNLDLNKIQCLILYGTQYHYNPFQLTAKQGLETMKKYAESFGTFPGSNSSIILPIYGVGEYAQGFSRIGAVFGGTYILSEQAEVIQVANNNSKVEVTTGLGNLSGDILISNVNYRQSQVAHVMNHLIVISRQQIFQESPNLAFYPSQNQFPFVLWQLDHSTNTVPDNLFLIHIISLNKTEAEMIDIKNILQGQYNLDEILSHYYFDTQLFNLQDQRIAESQIIQVNNGLVEMDLDFYLKQAEQIFNQIYPDLEFLPQKQNTTQMDYE